MYSRGSSTVLFTLAFVLLAALLAGCGGTDQSGNGAQGGAPNGKEQDGGAADEANKRGAAKKKAPAAKVALGTIESVWPERRRVELKPAAEKQGGELMVFRVRKKAEVKLEGKEAQLTDARKGQQAQIQYVVVKRKGKNQQGQANEQDQARTVNWASAVQLFKRGGGE
jgi:hypothetical protein